MAGSNLVQSLIRGLDILQIVAEAEGGIRINEIAEKLGVKNTTAHNLARTLTARVFLTKRSSKYFLGPTVMQLLRKQISTGVCNHAVGFLKDIAVQIPQATVVFCEFTGEEIVVRLRLSPDRPGIIQRPIQHTMLLYSTASGLLYQAFLNDMELKNLYERYPFESYGINLWRDRAKLDKFLERVRRKGYAVSPLNSKDYLVTAVPVKIEKIDDFIFVIGLTLPKGSVSGDKKEKRIIDLLKKTSVNLSSSGTY